MDIEDIERHKYNFRLFCAFLKKEGIYLKFKKLIFTNINRTPNDLFKLMNETSMSRIIPNIKDVCYDEIDRKWSAVFTFLPFCGFEWSTKNIGSWRHMMAISDNWCLYLIENNYIKQQK